MSEKVGGAEGTKLDYDFTEMEKASSPSTWQPKKHQLLSIYDLFLVIRQTSLSYEVILSVRNVVNRVPSAPV